MNRGRAASTLAGAAMMCACQPQPPAPLMTLNVEVPLHIYGVSFNLNDAHLTHRGQQAIHEIVQFAHEVREPCALVDGYSDINELSPLALSIQRAGVVALALREQGIEVKSTGFGASHPLVPHERGSPTPQTAGGTNPVNARVDVIGDRRAEECQ